MSDEPMQTSITEAVFAELAEVRTYRGMSFAALSSETDISKAHLVRLFNLKGNPTVKTIQTIARALDMSVTFAVAEIRGPM